jgi:UrcA family protein
MTRLYPRFAALALVASFAVTGATLASTGAPAYAADLVVSAPPSARVAYDDLNLRNPAGVKRLERRVRAAAEHLCIVRGEGALRARLDALACRDAATAAAEPQVRRAVARAGGASTLAFGR